MPLSADDIVNHEFRQSLRGYAIGEVDDLLDRLADQVERSDHDLEELRRRFDESETRIAEATSTETTLRRTLVTAQDAAQRTLDEARNQAEQLIEAAHARCEAMLEEAEREVDGILARGRADHELASANLLRLETIESRYREQLRDRLEAHLAELDALEADGPPAAAAVSDGSWLRPEEAGDDRSGGS